MPTRPNGQKRAGRKTIRLYKDNTGEHFLSSKSDTEKQQFANGHGPGQGGGGPNGKTNGRVASRAAAGQAGRQANGQAARRQTRRQESGQASRKGPNSWYFKGRQSTNCRGDGKADGLNKYNNAEKQSHIPPA